MPVSQAIDDRVSSLIERIDVNSPYDIEIPRLPLEFCTVDPELRSFSDGVVQTGTWVLYPFADTAVDAGRTCRVEASTPYYVSGFNTGYREATIKLLRKHGGARLERPTHVALISPEWEAVAEQFCRTGPDQGSVSMTVPTQSAELFISAPDPIYAVAVLFRFKLSGHALSMKTYLSRQASS